MSIGGVSIRGCIKPLWSSPRAKAWRHPNGGRLVEGVQRGGDCAPWPWGRLGEHGGSPGWRCNGHTLPPVPDWP